MKSISLFFLFSLSCLARPLSSFELEKLNYEQFIIDPYTEHIEVFQCLFSVTKIGSFLEFGMGRGTKYFLDHCDHVTSLEISIASRADAIDPWFLECAQSLRHYDNWKPIFYRASAALDFYNLWPSLTFYQQTQLYLPTHLCEFHQEVNAICSDVLKGKKYDLAFIDPGIFTRADFVNAMFDHVDIIVAHDTQDGIYGWLRLVDHPEYEKITYSSLYTATSVWIRKTKPQVIEDFKAKVRLIPKRTS